ncbi:MAG: hypothetical protein ACR2NM_01485 [Bythopirellula sp.]
MLSALYSLLILTTLAVTASDDRHIDAVEIYSCDFSKDVNYDRWPDDWQRRRGSEWPHYVDISLQEDQQAVAGRCLTVHCNGGSASVSSPAIAISQMFSYVLEARLKSNGLKNSRAQLRLDFCDENRQVLETHTSEWFTNTSDWVKVHIDPVSTENTKVQLALVTLVVERGGHVDLNGKVSLDDVWVARLPRMNVTTNSSFNVYTNPDDVIVTCELSGILEKDPNIHFELLDASSHKLDNTSIQLAGRLITERISRASDIVNTSKARVKGYAGSTRWHPPIKEFGYYRVNVSMQTKRGTLEERVISVAVVPPIREKLHGEFGWSLAGDDIPLSFQKLEELLPRVAVSWIKLPVWYGETETERGEQLVVLAERLAAKDIEIVGVIDRPPADLDLSKRVSEDVTIADLLSSEEPSSWLPSLDAVLTRLSLRVRWWQLGVDRDTSFSDFHNLEDEIGGLRDQLFRFGQDVKLGLGWPWLEVPSTDRIATWDFQQFSSTPALSGREIATYLDLPKRQGVARWAMIEPLARNTYDLETRTRDLVEQILAAKTHGADGIFVNTPFDEQRGLMTEKGTPGELLLPWRTTASLLSGSEYLGKIRLPQRSENHVFETADGEVLMVLWSRLPQQEVLYLGDDIRVMDVWGRTTKPQQQEHRQVLDVDSLPKFIVGLHPQVAKWRMKSRLSEDRIPSVMGYEHPNHFDITNTFDQGAGGAVELDLPPGWQVHPHKLNFKLSAGERTRRPFQIVLPFDANSGAATLRADFSFTADTSYHFSIYRDIKVGDQDIEIELHSRIDENGWLVVDQRMINYAADFADFKCLLKADKRKTQKIQVFRLGNSYDLQTYLFPNGKELIGTTLWLRAEELGGTRVLNHRIVVEQ